MGNRANRKLAMERLKQWGFKGRLWTGPRDWNNKNWAARDVLAALPDINLTIIYDCDGFNHRVLGLAGHTSKGQFRRPLTKEQIAEINLMSKSSFSHGFVVDGNKIPQLLLENDRFACGCGGIEPPHTRKQIEESFLAISEEAIKSHKTQGWWNNLAQFRLNALRNGEHICDEEGLLLPEFLEDYTKKEIDNDF